MKSVKFSYKGIVHISVLDKNRTVFKITHHNGALAGLQEAFAKMLVGYKTDDYRPRYIIGTSQDGTSSTQKIKITGLRLSNISSTDTSKCAQFNALIPCDIATAAEMLTYKYTLYSKTNDIALAKFEIDTTDIDMSALDKKGLQINIRWKMFLVKDEEE